MPIKIYLAGPLFSLNERCSNRRLADAIVKQMPGVVVELPQDYKYHGKFNDKRFFLEVYKACIAGVESADVIVAILDGPGSDDGTAYEVGYAVAKGKPVIGVRTDYRASQEMGCNLMLSRGCTAFVHRPSFDEDFDALARDIARKLRKLAAGIN
jgi:nucleoside 2-deoxyribosyltransferase